MPVSPFGMLLLTTSQQRFTCVGHILQPQLPTATRLAVATSPHGSVARLSGGGYSVPSASHPGVTPNARPGRVPVAEHRIFDFPDKYACDFVSHWKAKRRPAVPGRRGRARIVAVAQGRQFRSRGDNLLSAFPHAVQSFVVGSCEARARPLGAPRGAAAIRSGTARATNYVAIARVLSAAGAPDRYHER
jgi:hypothetical protein